MEVYGGCHGTCGRAMWMGISRHDKYNYRQQAYGGMRLIAQFRFGGSAAFET